MESKIAAALELKSHPVAIIWSNERPADAQQFIPERWGCVVSMVAAVASKGRTGVFDRDTFGCWGGGVGLGFGNCYETFPGGIDGFCAFLSDGNQKSEKGRAIGDAMAAAPGGARLADNFLHGERYLQTPETVLRFLDALPLQDIPAKYVVVKPLVKTDPRKDDIKSVTFFVEPDELSAMVVLANYRHPERENVCFPWGAGCQVMGIIAYRELEREHPRAVVGLADLSARRSVRPLLGSRVMSFTAPWPKFLEMEANVRGSFFERETWKSLRSKSPEAHS